MKKILLTILFFFVVIFVGYAPVWNHVYLIEEQPLRKGFLQFADDLGWVESRNDPTKINRIGCFGEHQWKESTLRYLGYGDITLKRFKSDPSIFPPSLQKQALRDCIEVNKQSLCRYERYIGTTIKGVRITQSGLLAACHLGGFKSVRLFLESGGKINKRDIFGTTIKDYIQDFQDYDL